MTRRDDLVLLGDMLDAARRAQRMVADVDKASYDADEMLQLALTRLVQIIGEAAREVSALGRSSLAQIPWPLIVGMRHRLVHAYRNVDLDILWSVVTVSLPPLIEAPETVVPSAPPDDTGAPGD